jgi:hypothetical protein
MVEKGKRHWIFSDGDLPPAGEVEPFGHEALMVVNANEEKANLEIDILFEDKDPIKGLTQGIEGERVLCIRLDKPVGNEQYIIPSGQYALVLHSDVPVVAAFGRLDVRQSNLAFYSVQGYSY